MSNDMDTSPKSDCSSLSLGTSSGDLYLHPNAPITPPRPPKNPLRYPQKSADSSPMLGNLSKSCSMGSSYTPMSSAPSLVDCLSTASGDFGSSEILTPSRTRAGSTIGTETVAENGSEEAPQLLPSSDSTSSLFRMSYLEKTIKWSIPRWLGGTQKDSAPVVDEQICPLMCSGDSTTSLVDRRPDVKPRVPGRLDLTGLGAIAPIAPRPPLSSRFAWNPRESYLATIEGGLTPAEEVCKELFEPRPHAPRMQAFWTDRDDEPISPLDLKVHRQGQEDETQRTSRSRSLAMPSTTAAHALSATDRENHDRRISYPSAVAEARNDRLYGSKGMVTPPAEQTTLFEGADGYPANPVEGRSSAQSPLLSPFHRLAGLPARVSPYPSPVLGLGLSSGLYPTQDYHLGQKRGSVSACDFLFGDASPAAPCSPSSTAEAGSAIDSKRDVSKPTTETINPYFEGA